MFPLAIGMLTQCWSDKPAEMIEGLTRLKTLAGESIQGKDDLLKQIRSGFDRSARDFLKQSQLADRPTFEELKAARDAGLDALAELLVKQTPTQLGSIADGAIQSKLEKFISALLAHGMDPNTKNQHGDSILSVAERHGADSPIYRLLKSAADTKR
jgi:ankyrin repeat protein